MNKLAIALLTVFCACGDNDPLPPAPPPIHVSPRKPSHCETTAVRDLSVIQITVDGYVDVPDSRVLISVATRDNQTVGIEEHRVSGGFCRDHTWGSCPSNIWPLKVDVDAHPMVFLYLGGGVRRDEPPPQGQVLCSIGLSYADGRALSAEEAEFVKQTNDAAKR